MYSGLNFQSSVKISSIFSVRSVKIKINFYFPLAAENKPAIGYCFSTANRGFTSSKFSMLIFIHNVLIIRA